MNEDVAGNPALGALETVLAGRTPPFDGIALYRPSRMQTPRPRPLIDFLKT